MTTEKKAHPPLYHLGRLTAAVFAGKSVPSGILGMMLTRPATGLANLMRRREWHEAKKYVSHIMAEFPENLENPAGGVKVEDQGPFWFGYYRYQHAMSRAAEFDEQDLARIGQLLYGERWQSDLARALGFDSRRVRQWMAKERRIPATVWDEVAALLLERQMSIDAVVHDFWPGKIEKQESEECVDGNLAP